MKKRIKKIQFHKGQDASQALLHKLIVNFISWGKMTTTQKRASTLKSVMDKLTYNAISQSESDKNILQSYIRNKKMVDYMIHKVAPLFKGRVGGYTRITKYVKRQGDNADVAMIRWTEAIEQFAPIVIKKIPVQNKNDEKKETKPEIIESEHKK